MSNVPQTQTQYEYVLPQDAKKLAVEAATSATYVFLHASRSLSRAEIEEQVRIGCERTKDTTRDRPFTNDFGLFTEISTALYTEAYLIVQEYYQHHPQELEIARQQIQEEEPLQCLHAIHEYIEADLQNRGLL